MAALFLSIWLFVIISFIFVFVYASGKAGKRLLLPVLLEDVNPQLAKGWLWACA